MLSPSPVPPLCRWRCRPARRAGKSAGAGRVDADTGIRNAEAQAGVVRRGGDAGNLKANFAGWRELDGVAQQIDQHLTDTLLVRHHQAGYVVGDVDRKQQALFFRPQTNHLRHIEDALTDIEDARQQFKPAGLHLGDIQNVGDHRQKMLAAVFDRLEGSQIALAYLGSLQQLGIAQDRIERRAQFMAHIGEKLRLGRTGGFGGRAGLGQNAAFLGLLALARFIEPPHPRKRKTRKPPVRTSQTPRMMRYH